ncbi:MAG TPA: hypothetical protein VHZ33_04290 [Trebonia sp.]|jgi:hypothetical protein|nr:hypothetical protein [Trebonia sp.]
MAGQDAEAFLRALVAPLSAARRGTPLPGVPFSREAVANAFVMLGLLPEALAEEILGQYRPLLKAEGFQIGVLTGELSVRPGAHGYHDAPPARPAGPRPAIAGVVTGTTDPPWPTPAECYLAALAPVTAMSIGTGGAQVDLDTAEITAAVADALLCVGALPPDSALLTGSGAAVAGDAGWRRSLAQRWGGPAYQNARTGAPDRADLGVGLPLGRATAVIESISALDALVSIQLYGHPWVSGEYWPMIAPCFDVRAIADTGAEHTGMSGGGSPRSGFEFTFWPPVAPAARRLTIIVSTLWEAAWAEVDIPGRPS